MCGEYIINPIEPDYCIHVSEAELISCLKKNHRGEYPIDYDCGEHVAVMRDYSAIEPIVITEKIASYMLEQNILLMHGAAVAVGHKCYIFTAPSGTGKTTHIMNWLKVIPGSFVVNGDKPLIDVEHNLVYGTPWSGKENMNTNAAVPLAGIIALERGKINVISSVTIRDILPVLVRQTFFSENRKEALKSIQLAGRLKNVPFYKLSCNMDEESALVAYQGLTRTKVVQ